MHTAFWRAVLQELPKKAGVSKRCNPQTLRYSFAADLIVEGRPLPFLQYQLEITTLHAMQNFLTQLNMPQPDPAEVVSAIRARPTSWTARPA